MNKRKQIMVSIYMVITLGSLPTLLRTQAQPLGTGFTYQGLLRNGGIPAHGPHDCAFTLWDDPLAGIQVGPTLTFDGIGGNPPPIDVTDGLFTVELDFGAAAFTGEVRWLEIAVNGVLLTPRQELTAAPHALFSTKPWATSDNHIHNTNTGNVGIGTTSPTDPLTVNGVIRSVSGGVKFPDDTVQTTAASALAANTRTPQQIALLRWYDAIQTGQTFAVGNSPRSVTFDGAHIWVANHNSANVTKLRASDGSNLGTFPVSSGPTSAAFDGANVWVTNFSNSNVSKLRASDGADLGTFPVGTGPTSAAFDGANVWVANQNSNNVTKLRASDGANLGTFPVGSFPSGVAFDGVNIWVTNSGSNNVTKLRASDGANLGTFPVGTSPTRVAFDGANIWVANGVSNSVSKL